MQTSFRKIVLWLHTWVGLTLGLAMVFLAVTGGVLVMRPHFEDTLNRRLVSVPACGTPQSLDSLAARAAAAHPASRPASIEVRREPGTSVAVQFRDKDYVYLDPCSGQILGVQNQYGGLFGKLDWLHRFRFMEMGRLVGGTMSAFALVFVIVGGIYLWWPKSRAAAKGALLYNPKLPGLARTLSLHKVLGAYAAALLLVMTVTALPLSFAWAKGAVAWAAGSTAEGPEPPAIAAPPAHAKRLKMQALWAIAQAEAPTVQWAALKYPKKKTSVVTIEMLERGAPHKNAKSYLYLDPISGQTVGVKHYATDITSGRKAYLYILALHSGLVGGIPYQLALLIACFTVPVQAYSGFSPYIRKQLRKAKARTGLSLQLVARTVEATNVCSFEFVHPKGEVLPAFSAGSHIDLKLGDGLVRQYSLCNHPDETHRYLIAVLRETDSRGGSRRLHEELKIGEILDASPPRNHFPLTHADGPILLIAGGIGITPILCMAERLSKTGADFSLHYCARSLSDAAFADRIMQSSFADRAMFHLSERGGRLNVRRLLEPADRASHIYVCGPNRLIDEVVETALDLGWPDANVHREYFVAEPHDTANDEPFAVRIASTGLTINVPKDRSVVAALASHGIEIPTSCAEGICGTCLTRVLEGEVRHRDMLLTPEERARNDQFTPCCSRAAGPVLVLDL